jgi:hypothetical protein
VVRRDIIVLVDPEIGRELSATQHRQRFMVGSVVFCEGTIIEGCRPKHGTAALRLYSETAIELGASAFLYIWGKGRGGGCGWGSALW